MSSSLLTLLALASVAPSADEIIVTGERREQPKEMAASSVSTVGDEEIRRVNADHPAEILNRMAGVLIHRGNGQEHLTAIRSPVLTSGAGAGSFLFLEDGVPLRAAGFANVNGLFESTSELAERIEVVRGPSGALYGANAIHGVINVVNRDPTDKLSFLAEISGDTIGRIKGLGFISNTIGDNGFVAGVSVLDDPGYRAESGADDQKFYFRHRYRGEAVTVRSSFAAYNLNQETAGFVEGPSAYLDETLRRANANPNSFRDAKGARVSSRIDISLGEGLTLSSTPFARWNEMAFRLHFFPSQALETNSHWSLGAQNALYIDRENFSAIIGIDAEYSEGDLTEFQSRPTILSYTQGLHYDYAVTSASASPFASVSVEVTPRLRATLAGRFDYAHYEYDNRTATGVVGRFLRPAARSDSYATFSPKLSAIYDLGPAGVFASYARGARPPQTTDLYRLQINQAADPAKAETIDAFELGVKGASGPVVFEAAGYFMSKRNFFFRDADGFNVNDGRTRHVGGEAELTLSLAADVTIDAGVSYARHTYRFDRGVLSVPQASERIAFGNEVDTAPNWLAGVRAQWAPEAAPWSLEFEWSRTGAYFMDAANTAVYPGHDIVNIRAGWKFSPRLSANIALRNVFDTLYAERADFAFGAERYFPGEERVFAITLRVTE